MTALGSKPIQAFAEGSEEEVSLASESVEESIQESEEITSEGKTNPIDSVVIDGKTIEQWKKELADEQTRGAAITGIIVAGVGALIVFLRWLAEHGRISKLNAQALALKEKAEELNKLLQETKKEYLDPIDATYQGATDVVNGGLDKANAVMKKALAKFDEVEQLLLIMMQSDPNLIASDAYYKAMNYIKQVKSNGEEE